MKANRMVIIGGCGNIGKKLKREWPTAISVDREKDADFVYDLRKLGSTDTKLHDVLASSDVVIHLATSADPEATDTVHFQSLENTAKLVNACACVNVPKLILASSDWAEPNEHKINTYGHSKRVMEAMSEMYSQNEYRVSTAIRIGWVPDDDLVMEEAPEWLLKNYWSTSRLIEEFNKVISIEPNE